MVFLKIASILFLILIPILSFIIVKFLGLRKRGMNFADLAFPLFILGFYLISDRVYYHSLLPLLGLSLSLLAIGIALFLLLRRREFSYHRFLKFFWRAGFILTFLLYLSLTISLFFVK